MAVGRIVIGLMLAAPASPGPARQVVTIDPARIDGLTDLWKVRAPYLKVDWRAMRGPMLIVSGGNDDGPMARAGRRWREEAYDRGLAGRRLCLLRIVGGGHYLGGIDGPLRPPAGDATPDRIARVTVAMTPRRRRRGRWFAAIYPTNDGHRFIGWWTFMSTVRHRSCGPCNAVPGQ